MKKLSIMLMLALSLGFASCDDKWTEAEPQSNPQEPAFAAENLVVANAMPEAIDLKALNEAGDTVKVLTVTEAKNLPAGSTLEFVMQLSKTEDFAKYEEVAASFEDNTLNVMASDWQTAHLKVFGRSPKAKTAYVRYAAYVIKNELSTVRIGGPDVYYGNSTVSVTPYPSELVIEEKYYLVGTINDWTVAKGVEFNHTGDVYDNPVFTIKVDVSNEAAKAGWWWKIVPESTYKTGDWVDAANGSYGVEVNGDEATEGMLVARTADTDCGAGCLKTAGQLLLTINLEEGTYAFTSAVDFLYTPGVSNNWNQEKSQKLGTSDYDNYSGYAYLSADGFKFTNALDWNHTNYGAGDAEGMLSTDGGAGDIMPAATGLYWLTVSTSALTYTMTQVTTYGLIGDATPGGWDASTALTPTDATSLVWKGTVTLKGGELKFRANDGWDINLGGDLKNLTQGGNNIASPGEGTYEVTLDLSAIPYTATLVKK